MSVKRQATTELNHENWDKEDPADHEEVGSFKIASNDILEKRVIRTAKRRSQITNDEPNKSVFSGFGGFNKQQPTSFDFLSKLTNGKNENNSVTSKADSTETSSIFTSKPFASSPGATLFSVQPSIATLTKSPFGSPPTPSGGSSLFGVSSTNTTPTNPFTLNTDSAVSDSPNKIQTVTSSTDNKTVSPKSTTSSTSTSSKFDIPTTSTNITTSLFSSTSSPFQIQPVTKTVQSNFGTITKSETKSTEETEKKSEDNQNDSKMKYYSKLKRLNESVSDWIKKHVEETPLCILTPIFKDYEKYIKQIQEEYQGVGVEEKKLDDKQTTPKTQANFGSSNTKLTLGENDKSTGSMKFNLSPSSGSLFAPQSKSSETTNKQATFSFGITAVTTASSNITSNPPTFSFGISTTSQSNTTTSSPFSIGSTSTFSFAANTSTTTSTSTSPFSFGIGKPFSFNSNIQQNSEKTEESNSKEEEDDSPPKVEYTPIVEENSVYDKKCKLFVKKDGNFVDKGVGTLYIKKVEEGGKHQLLLRANTNLGTILVNLILVSGIPTQRMGKNNVMMVCIPTPDSKPPPTPILIRVKTSEEADELLATLDKYKT